MDKEKEYHDLLNSGTIYDCYNPDLVEYQHTVLGKVQEYNAILESDDAWGKRTALIKEMSAECGEHVCILPPFHANWALKRVHFGKNVFVNYNSSFVDDADIYIGDNCMFGPNITLCTASHPISPTLRKAKLEYNKPIHIGKNCWLGANVVVLPGVTIGDNSVIGAGSIVTHDIPANKVAVGNPAHILRDITERDDHFYDHDKEVPASLLEKYQSD